MESQIHVKSHVGRDLIQSANSFGKEDKVVWEYVSNGLQYVDAGVNPIVKVTLDSKNKKITVDDNGRGMDWRGLQNFFLMHGENIDRKMGRPGRGLFGTGKSAAFGIADILKVTTVKNSKRSCVELHRADINAMTSGNPIPVKTVEKEILTEQRNGTKIEIEKVQLKTLNQASVIKYIERHLKKWRNATVLVNNHQCESSEPEARYLFTYHPEGEIKNMLDDVELLIKAAYHPPEDGDDRGISVYSNGVWHATTLAGLEGKEMAQYIFGDIDVPKLDIDTSIPAPFDSTRSMTLNPQNELVRVILAFINTKAEEVRKKLVEEEKERKKTEEAKKLNKHAEELARIINEDFSEFRERIKKIKSMKSETGIDLGLQENGTGENDIITQNGDDFFIQDLSLEGSPGARGDSRGNGGEPRHLEPEVQISSDSEDKGKITPSGKVKPPSKGGFSIEFKPMGEQEPRAFYARELRTIFINTDFPRLEAIKKISGSIESREYKEIAYEYAFAEYAIALAVELNERGEYLETSDPILDIRESVNRMSRKAARYLT